MYMGYLQQSNAEKEQVCIATKLVEQEVWKKSQNVVLGGTTERDPK